MVWALLLIVSFWYIAIAIHKKNIRSINLVIDKFALNLAYEIGHGDTLNRLNDILDRPDGPSITAKNRLLDLRAILGVPLNNALSRLTLDEKEIIKHGMGQNSKDGQLRYLLRILHLSTSHYKHSFEQ